jgi:hypothetical protein
MRAGSGGLHRETCVLTWPTSLEMRPLAEASRQFIRPARLAGAVFFLDDLQNLSLPSGDTALTILMMDPAPVARLGVDSLLHRRSSVVAGLLNKVIVFGNRFSPRSLQRMIMQSAVRG